VAIMVKNKTVYIMIACWVVAMLNIGFNALLIPRYGIVGAGAATGLAYMLFALSYALISGRLWAVSYPGRVVAVLLVLPLAAIGLITLIAYSGPGIWINLLLKLLVTALCGVALLLVVMRAEGLRMAELITLAKKMAWRSG
jgi:O-antigen/teichoic acid export membrane protein